MQNHLLQAGVGERHHRDDALPQRSILGQRDAVARERVIQRLRIELERFIGVRGIAAHALELEDEIAQAVADRPALVQLDAPGDMWTRAEEGVRPGVDARMMAERTSRCTMISVVYGCVLE